MLNWVEPFSIFCFLDNNHYDEQNQFEFCLAVGVHNHVQLSVGNAFGDLQNFYDEKPRWLFGHLGYELKNEIEQLTQNKSASVDFGAGYFFEPQIVIRLKKGHLQISSQTRKPEILFKEILKITLLKSDGKKEAPVLLQPLISKEKYLENLAIIKHHIAIGNCYEINYCQQFNATNVCISPLKVFNLLNESSPNPFAAFYKLKNKYCLCASPERYLQKIGQQLISQPIKGTSKRNLLDDLEDVKQRDYLLESHKEKAENVMVVDLVRNDMSKVCEPSSVKVKELFGLYSFPQVHQMISTIEGTMPAQAKFSEALKATFPMGSMTGAPKKKVMQIIDETEPESRGLFSGAIGYISPEEDFDFNVVIRSIFYDEEAKVLTAWAGGGITHYSEAEKEYEESLLKIGTIKKILAS